MGTVTYKNQPGVASALKRGIPLAGTSHIYTVQKVLWPEAVEATLGDLLVGKSLHICCGESKLGSVRLDRYAPNVDVVADASQLPFPDEAFDSVLCDPPYNGKLQWNHDVLIEMARVAKSRIVFQHWFMPIAPDGSFKKARSEWKLSAVYVWQPRTYFGRVQVVSVLDRIDG